MTEMISSTPVDKARMEGFYGKPERIINHQISRSGGTMANVRAARGKEEKGIIQRLVEPGKQS